MPIEVYCTTCSYRAHVKSKYAGRRVRCPKCQSRIEVPQLSDRTDGPGRCRAHVLSTQSARRACPADRRHGGFGAVERRRHVPARPARASIPRSVARVVRSRARHALGQVRRCHAPCGRAAGTDRVGPRRRNRARLATTCPGRGRMQRMSEYSVLATGTPSTIASSTTLGKPSRRLLSANTSAASYSGRGSLR